MSSDLTTIVTVPVTCSRAQKDFQLKLPLEEVGPHVALMKKKAEVAKEVSATISGLNAAPDLIVFYKGKGVVFANVHDSQDVAVQRLVNLIAKSEVFALPEPTKRKKGEPAEVEVAVDEEEG